MPTSGVLAEPQRVSVGRGWNWITQGFDYFKRAPWIWMLNTVIFVVITALLEQAPLFGDVLSSILYPVFFGGFMAGCCAQDQGEALQVGHLFVGFRDHANTLAAVGGLYVLGGVAIILLAFGLIALFGGNVQAIIAAMTHQGPLDPQTAQMLRGAWLPVLPVMLILGIVMLMTVWFAAPLVMFHSFSAIQAMKLSFQGCQRNLGAFLLYALLTSALLVLGAIPFGLGLLVILPVLIASTYVGYKEIFLQPAEAAQ